VHAYVDFVSTFESLCLIFTELDMGVIQLDITPNHIFFYFLVSSNNMVDVVTTEVAAP
jgi:hypothetical protein